MKTEYKKTVLELKDRDQVIVKAGEFLLKVYCLVLWFPYYVEARDFCQVWKMQAIR